MYQKALSNVGTCSLILFLILSPHHQRISSVRTNDNLGLREGLHSMLFFQYSMLCFIWQKIEAGEHGWSGTTSLPVGHVFRCAYKIILIDSGALHTRPNSYEATILGLWLVLARFQTGVELFCGLLEGGLFDSRVGVTDHEYQRARKTRQDLSRVLECSYKEDRVRGLWRIEANRV